MPWNRVGGWLIAIGVLHNLVGLMVGGPVLLEIMADGWVAAVPDDAPMRMALFWFLWFGWLAILLGASWLQIERRGLVVPAWQGLAMIVIGLLGALAMPISGFWLVLPVGAVVMARSWRANRARSPATADRRSDGTPAPSART